MFSTNVGVRLCRTVCLSLALLGGATAATTSYTVRAGDTLYSIARTHGVSLDGLAAVNSGLSSATTLRVGQRVQVPVITRAATQQRPAVRAAGFSDLGWIVPLSGIITTPYGGERSSHDGVDIAAPSGLPVLAGQGGTVIEARFDGRTGWGWTLVIDHGNGYTSRYSHNSALLVRVGDVVARGQTIARVGSTGNSTGPHLDYRVYRGGVAVNPLRLATR